MPISREVVDHVARLAHIGLTAEEIDSLTHELSSVLDHVARLQEIDTTEVPPTAHIVSIDNVMRDDVVCPPCLPAEILANAPHRTDDLFEVQAVLD